MRVSVPAGRTLAFYFNGFRLESNSNCEYDSLKVRQQQVKLNKCWVYKMKVLSLLAPVSALSRHFPFENAPFLFITFFLIKRYFIVVCKILAFCKSIYLWSANDLCLRLNCARDFCFNSLRLSHLSNSLMAHLFVLQVLNGSQSGSELATLCGAALPSPIFVNNGDVSLRFSTDSSVHYSGFDISYTSTTSGKCTCTHLLNRPSCL